MDDKKELIKNFSGIAISTGLALATQGSSNIALGVLSGIAGNLASSYIEKADYNKIRTLLNDRDPSELNHDLTKLVVKSIRWSLKNIEILYLKTIYDPIEIKQTKDFVEDLSLEVKVLEDTLSADEKNFIHLIEKETDVDKVLSRFDLDVDRFPQINSANPFNTFFKKEFQANLQLCFSELLKDEKYRPAYIAYQKMVFNNLSSDIEKVIEQNNKIIAKLDDSTAYRKKNQSYKNVQKEINTISMDSISPLFASKADDYFKELSSKTDLILEKSDFLIYELAQVKRIAKGISKDLKKNWIEKNQVYVYSGAVAFILIITALFYYINTQPFTQIVNLVENKAIEINQEYPQLSTEAKLRIFLPNETKIKEMSTFKELILNNLTSNLKEGSYRVELIDPYWKLSTDSMSFQSKNYSLEIEPNDALAIVTGRVLSRDGQDLLTNAKIIVSGESTNTDSLGNFKLELPVAKRKKRYELRVEKEDYKAKELEYYPGSEIEIRLERDE